MQAVDDLYQTLEDNALQLQALSNRAVPIPSEVRILTLLSAIASSGWASKAVSDCLLMQVTVVKKKRGKVARLSLFQAAETSSNQVKILNEH